MSWRTENGFDEESTAILDIVMHFLTVYFGHEPDAADDLITEYFRKFNFPHVDEAISHAGAWRMAKRIHFTIGLGGDAGEQVLWEVANDLRSTPEDARAYVEKHYWQRFGS